MKKRYLTTFLTILLSFTLIFTGCASSSSNSKDDIDESAELVKDAFIYTFPLVMMDATMTTFTNTEEAKADNAPVNWLAHSTKLADATFKDVVAPNRDTVYSKAFLDLSKEPMVFEKPKTDRFCSVEIMDFFTNAIGILGSGGSGEDKETCVIVGEDYDGDLPKDMTVIKSPTQNVCIIVRTMIYNDDDMANVSKIQSEMKLMPLSSYISGEEYKAPKGTYREQATYSPIEHVYSLTPDEYFETANELLKTNPPNADDKDMVDKISKIGVGPGEKFDVSLLGEKPVETWENMLMDMNDYLYEKSSKFLHDIGGWSFPGEPVANFGTEYEYRALIATVALLANPVDVAIYPQAEFDAGGNELNSESNYVIHLDKDSIPPTEEHGFWSITAYNQSQALIDNELDRYLINDRSDVKKNDDGSFDIYLQSDKPKDAEKVSNWLPTGNGVFSLVIRIYMPTDEVKSGEWKAPSILRVD